jgi:hypothetical protein
MVYRTRIKYTAAQKADIWDRWQRGESLNSIGRLFDRPSSSIFNMFAPTAGSGAEPDIQTSCTENCHSTAGIPPKLTVPLADVKDSNAATIVAVHTL